MVHDFNEELLKKLMECTTVRSQVIYKQLTKKGSHIPPILFEVHKGGTCE